MQKEHIRKNREKARALRKSNWWKNLIQNASCYYCEKKIQPNQVTMDHVVPVSRGGKSNKGNIVAACKACNTMKKNKTARYRAKLKAKKSKERARKKGWMKVRSAGKRMKRIKRKTSNR